MNYTNLRLFSILALVFLAPRPAGAEEPAPGKSTFLLDKCNFCHAIKSEGIERTLKESTKTGKDLSDIGTKRQQKWLAEFLQKKQVAENGKKHTKKFRGKEPELAALTTWLAGLKNPHPEAK